MPVATVEQLAPLPYHRYVVAYLRRHEAEVWAMFASAQAEAEYLDGLRGALLRSTYRLEPEAHPDVFESAARAAAALGQSLPLAIYHAEGTNEANAALVFVPDELIVVLSGGILSLLDGDELCAVFGHEFAHHLLWTAADSVFLTADRLLNAAESDPRAGASHAETRRRYALATELFADRGHCWQLANSMSPCPGWSSCSGLSRWGWARRGSGWRRGFRSYVRWWSWSMRARWWSPGWSSMRSEAAAEEVRVRSSPDADRRN